MTASPPAPSESDTDRGNLVGIDEIREAARRIAGTAVRTPLMPSPWPGLWLKPEMLQPVGAFKIRGAINAIARLDPAVRARGVLTHSSGNHAQAVAFAARAFGISAHIVIPDNAPARKVEATRALGATVELVPVAQRFSRTEELARETGRVIVPPFDHLDVIAGQGTIGLEIAEDWPARAGGSAGITGSAGIDAASTADNGAPGPGASALPAAILVPVSGGGLIAGIAAAAAALLPGTAVIGVEPELAGDAAASFRARHRIEWSPADTARTVADGLRTFCVGEIPWRHITAYVDDIVTVAEDEILAASRMLALQARIVAEPSGAVPVAAHLFHSDQLPAGDRVAVVSGGNIDPALLARLLADA